MEIKDVKRFNLALLASKHGGRLAMAEILGYCDANHFNQMCGGFSAVGPRITAKIYDKIDLPPMWLETPRLYDWIELDDKSFRKWRDEEEEEFNEEVERVLDFSGNPKSQVTPADKINSSWSDKISTSTKSGERGKESTDVQSYELWAGIVAKEVRGMTVPADILSELNLKATDVLSIKIPDNSQGPRILKGDIGIISTSQSGRLKNDTLYAVKLGDAYTLRIVSYQHDGAVKLLCANPEYASAEETIPSSDVNSLDILGEYIFGGMRPL